MDIKQRIELYCNWACAIANDNSHGYSQIKRWSPDYDCSYSLVISALENAGFQMRKNGASYTGNMMTALMRCDFKLVQDGSLVRGDILLTHNETSQHTAIYLGDNKIVHARGVNGHPEEGDQTGNEITISNYYPFARVFRHKDITEKAVKNCMIVIEEISQGCNSRTVKTMQILLNEFGGYFLEVDGIAGNATITALTKYQRENGLLPDGICGVKTWSKLLKGV